MSVFSSELSSELNKGIIKIEEHFLSQKKGISKLFIINYDNKIELFQLVDIYPKQKCSRKHFVLNKKN